MATPCQEGEWLAQLRHVPGIPRTAKDDNSFCYPDHIASQMDGLLGRLNDTAFLPRLFAT